MMSIVVYLFVYHPLVLLFQDLQAEEVLFRCINRAGEQHLGHLESVAGLSLASFEAVGARFRDYPTVMRGQGGPQVREQTIITGEGEVAVTKVCITHVELL